MSKKLRRQLKERGRQQRDNRRGDLRSMIEERSALGQKIEQMRGTLDERRSQSKSDPKVVPEFSAEEEAAWKKVNADFDRLDRHIDVERQARKRQQRLDAIDPDDYDVGRGDVRLSQRSRKFRKEAHERKLSDEQCRAVAMQAWLRSVGGKDLKPEHVAACRQIGFNPHARKFDVRLSGTETFRKLQRSHVPQHHRSLLSDGAASTGSALVGTTFVNNLETALLDYSGVMKVADVMDTESGEPLVWPTMDDTSNQGSIIGENSSLGTEAKPSFGQQVWNWYKFSSNPLLLTQEMMEDSAINLVSVIPDLLGERIGRKANSVFTTGDGAKQPYGFVTEAPTGKTTAASGAITANEIIDLVHSIDPAVRGQGCSFMLHDLIIAEIRKLKDSQGRYIWNDMLAGIGQMVGGPTLLGYPVNVNQAMDSTLATTKKTIAFGNFGKYKVRRVRSMRLIRLVEYYRTTYDADGFIAVIRMDGKTLGANLPTASKPIKLLVQV
jgi:HK97 family phage major capsid protein